MYSNEKTLEETLDKEPSEGAYVFKPEWRSPLPTKYGKLSEDVVYQKGALLEQWTISLNDPVSDERAIIKVRKSEVFSELLEFDVELAPVS